MLHIHSHNTCVYIAPGKASTSGVDFVALHWLLCQNSSCTVWETITGTVHDLYESKMYNCRGDCTLFKGGHAQQELKPQLLNTMHNLLDAKALSVSSVNCDTSEQNAFSPLIVFNPLDWQWWLGPMHTWLCIRSLWHLTLPRGRIWVCYKCVWSERIPVQGTGSRRNTVLGLK